MVPISPADLERKKVAIFVINHRRPGDVSRAPTGEFWQRAEDRNKGTAKLYDALGLPEFYALEGFVRWKG